MNAFELINIFEYLKTGRLKELVLCFTSSDSNERRKAEKIPQI